MSDDPVFEIGLAMAGAISAGAYSGGVFDFLCEALNEWELAKKGNVAGVAAADVPRHQVCIKVMSGASAGALTGAVGLLALSKGVAPLTAGIVKSADRYTLPALHDAWVTKVDLDSASGNPDLLGLSDFKDSGGKTARLSSVLDSTVLDWIADEVVAAKPPPGAVPPPYPWIGAPLHLYMMVTNLRGIPYGVSFDAGLTIEDHVMQCHGDRVHFTITDLGTGTGESDFTKADPVDGTFKMKGSTRKDLDTYIDCSLASSAFPIALSPRQIDSLAFSYEGRQWPSLTTCIKPYWPAGYSPVGNKRLAYMAPDGGIIDNEPFEYAHSGILPPGGTLNDFGADTVSRAVIMIDPFPEPPDFDTIPVEKPMSFASVPGKLISAMKNQARFKPDEVAKALDPEHYSRYLIAPRLKDSDRVSSAALATGLLGGFGGFLDQSFREYDYQLGRYNCQRFLQEYFTVGKNNAIAAAWPAVALASQTDDRGQEIRIVPLYGSAATTVVLPPRPRIGMARVDAILARVKTRANAVIGRLFSENIGSSIARAVLNVGWTFARGPVLDDTARWAILQGLIDADQLQELAATDANGKSKGDLARAVLIVASALSDTAFDYCSGDALVAALDKGSTKLSPHLADAVKSLNANPQTLFQVWTGAITTTTASGAPVTYGTCYCWTDRRPSWVSRQISQPPKVNDPKAD